MGMRGTRKGPPLKPKHTEESIQQTLDKQTEEIADLKYRLSFAQIIE